MAYFVAWPILQHAGTAFLVLCALALACSAGAGEWPTYLQFKPYLHAVCWPVLGTQEKGTCSPQLRMHVSLRCGDVGLAVLSRLPQFSFLHSYL